MRIHKTNSTGTCLFLRNPRVKQKKGINCSYVIFVWQWQCVPRSAHRLERFAGCHNPSMICLELFNGTLNHILISQVTAPFSKSCADHKLYSTAIGNNYGERRTQRANNYYHVQQRYEVIAHSLCCLLPTNGMPWELQQGPIRFEGHKQVAEFLFYGRLTDGHQTPNKKTTVKLYQQPILRRNEQHEGYQQHCSAVDATVFR